MQRWPDADPQSLGTLLRTGTASGLSDTELLVRFRAGAGSFSEAAFEAIVRRHGAMVLAVCRSTLDDRHDAEDAFQATFLVLATRADAILRTASVGSWLHGVALRIARRIQVRNDRRKAGEREFLERTARESTWPRESDTAESLDMELLHREIDRLPRKYRDPILLCAFQGMTHESAAGRLGCRPSTVGVRLLRARRLLKGRLSRRDETRPGADPILALPARFELLPPPDSLVASTLVQVTAGRAASLVKSDVARLASEIAGSMVLTRLARFAALALAVGIASTSIGAALVRTEPGGESTQGTAVVSPRPEFRVGQQVVTKSRTPHKEGGKVVDSDEVFRVYTVSQVDGGQVRIGVPEVSGWVDAGALVLLDEAITFFTTGIKNNPGNADAYLRRGLLRKWFLESDEAIADLTEAIRLRPDWFFPVAMRGYVHQELKRDGDRAIVDFTEAIRLEPRQASVHAARGTAWFEKKEFAKAIADLDASLLLAPDDAVSLIWRGRDRIEADDLDGAIADLTRAIELRPDDARIHADRGLAWYYDGNLDNALADYDKAIRLMPDDAELYVERGDAWFYKGDLDRSVADYSESIRLDPLTSMGHRRRGRAYAARQEYDKSLADFDEALRIDPRNPDLLASRAATRLSLNQIEEAIADSSKALNFDPDCAGAYYNRGLAWMHKDEPERAIRDYGEAIRLNGSDANALFNRSRAWFITGQYEKALADVDHVIRLDDRDPKSYEMRGLICRRLKRFNDAIRALDRAIELDPRDTDAYVRRGSIRGDLGQHDQSFVDFDRAIELDPQNSTAYAGRAYAQKFRKDYQRACADYQEAIRIDPSGYYSYAGLAWIRSTFPEAEYRDGAQAVELATKACELTKWKDPWVLEKLAAAHAERGDFAAAVKWQTQANDLRHEPESREGGQKLLRLYQAKQPYRDNGE